MTFRGDRLSLRELLRYRYICWRTEFGVRLRRRRALRSRSLS